MDIRIKIIIAFAAVMALVVGIGSIALYNKEFNDLKESAALYGISADGMSKSELKTAIDDYKNAVNQKNLMDALIKKAEKYGIEYEGLYYERLKELVDEYEKNRVSLSGRIFSIVASADMQSRTWLVVGEGGVDSDYAQGYVIVNGQTPIYKGDELVAYDKVKEGTQVKIMFSKIIDEEATPITAFASKVSIVL